MLLIGVKRSPFTRRVAVTLNIRTTGLFHSNVGYDSPLTPIHGVTARRDVCCHKGGCCSRVNAIYSGIAIGDEMYASTASTCC